MAPIDKNTPAQELVHNYAPHIKDKVILTTGVSPGSLGAYFMQSIASASPKCLILAGRNRSKIQATADEIKAAHPSVQTRLLEIDLASLASVRTAAAQVNSWGDIPAIDVVVNNAGIMATEYALSGEGVEAQFATNHLGPFLFTNLIMGKVLASSRPRVVMVASDGHRLSGVRFGDWNFDVSCLFFHPRAGLTRRLVRMARHTIDGLHTGRPRRRICSWRYL
jgi:NAD(P)-dependent dehydrogenase (short-subunit alcohol dehydrogenase family)